MTEISPGQADEIPDAFARYIRAAFPPEVLANIPNEITGRWKHMTGPAEREFWRSADAAQAELARVTALVAQALDDAGVDEDTKAQWLERAGLEG